MSRFRHSYHIVGAGIRTAIRTTYNRNESTNNSKKKAEFTTAHEEDGTKAKVAPTPHTESTIDKEIE